MNADPSPEARSIQQLTPNGLLLVDERAHIQFVNPAFRKMFQTGDEELIGRKASEIVQSDCFERSIAAGKELSARGSIPEIGVYYRAEIFRTEGEEYCGIFIDTSEEERARAELMELKRETLARAEEVIRRQMQTAQEIAGLLGETTAETKVLLAKLTDIFRQEREDVKVFYEYGLRQLNKKEEELCGDSVIFSMRPELATLVLSDGMGSGVKASILSTLTTRIAARMLAEGLALDEVVRTVSETLPICRVRKIAYSTFVIAQLFDNGLSDVVLFDSPAPFVIHKGRMLKLDFEECDIGGKRICDYGFTLSPGDWLILVSDGVLNAGIGGAYPLGWGWEEVAGYLENHVHDLLSAEEMATKLARVVGELYEGRPGDDVSIAVIKARRKRTVTIFTGPPTNREDDERIVDLLMSADGTRVVCGGTSANILARRLDKEVVVDLETGTSEVPATGRIEGIDLVTEGTLTITKVLDILRADPPDEELKLKIDGASRLGMLLRDADEVKVLVGRAMNPAHQNPNLPRQLGLKTQVVQSLGEELRQKGKEVEIEFF